RFSWLRMPCLVCSSEWHGKARLLSGFGTTSTAQVSAPVRHKSLSMTQRATSSPIPGSPELKRSLFFIHSEQPAGIEEDRVARLDVALLHVLTLQGRADIGNQDLLAGIHHAAFDRGEI